MQPFGCMRASKDERPRPHRARPCGAPVPVILRGSRAKNARSHLRMTVQGYLATFLASSAAFSSARAPARMLGMA